METSVLTRHEILALEFVKAKITEDTTPEEFFAMFKSAYEAIRNADVNRPAIPHP